jgi:excisionase family DNA binding protein
MDLLTLPEAAKELDIHPTTLRRWIADRSISYIRLPSGQYRFRPEVIHAILDGQEPVPVVHPDQMEMFPDDDPVA